MAELKFFIVPRGRTGGTLLATMLNAHPQISMGYEIYPDLLVAKDTTPFDPPALVRRLNTARKHDNEAWTKGLETDNFRTFVARARRSGIEPSLLLNVLRKFATDNRTFTSLEHRLDFIEELLHQQAAGANKPYVGGKMRVDPDVLYARHPKSVYLMMLRDGRDVLDSRLKVGNFQTSPADCARQWRDDLAGFEEFLKRTGANGTLVRYEDLVANPEKVLSEIMHRADLEYSTSMANFAKAEQPLFHNPHGHLSARQLQEGLSNSSIGRWQNGLSEAQLQEFMQISSEAMARYGYA